MGLYKNAVFFLFYVPKYMLLFFYCYCFLRWYALCSKSVIFPAFCGCQSILGRKSTNVLFLSFCFHVRFILTSLCIHFPSCSFLLTGQVGIRPNGHVFIIYRYCFCYRVAIVLEACAVCHLQGSCTCTRI